MRDLGFLVFLAGFFALGLKRPFLLVLAYCYIDIVAPQKLSYFLINQIPLSLIAFLFAIGGWVLADDKRDTRIAPRQVLLFAILIYCGLTTNFADFPVEAQDKWAWVWKALVWAIFLPLTLRTRLRIEALAVIMLLSAASIAISGGIKTLASGGGYGSLRLLLDANYGLYEGSIMSCVAISIIPLIWWVRNYGTLFPKHRLVTLFCIGLTFACLLIPVGTQARTGLVCIGVLAVLLLRTSRHKFALIGGAVALTLVAVPFMPQSFFNRMSTIKEHKSDQSASTRVAVWMWTIDYAKSHPFGGGFEAYRQNHVTVDQESKGGDAVKTYQESSRAYHSSYFEMLGEQGYPGLTMWLILHIGGIIQMERLRRRYRKSTNPNDVWIVPLANALQQGNIIYMVGSLFVGIAFQPFIYMMLAMQMGLSTYLKRRDSGVSWAGRPAMARASAASAGATATPQPAATTRGWQRTR